MGADTAVRLAQLGYDVAITARDEARLGGVARQIEDAGGRALPLASDLTDRSSMTAFADAAEKWAGRCDVLCNIGVYQGPGARQLFGEMPIEELALSMEADVVAPALLIQRAIPLMLDSGGGSIVNMSSAVVFLDPAGTVKDQDGWSLAYAAGKAGIDQFAKVLNAELGSSGIRAFTVEPGFVAYGEAYRALLRDRPGVPVSPPEAVGAAIAWIVATPEADRLQSKRINLPALAHKHGLLPGWEGPGTAYMRPEQNRSQSAP
jgi:NAD(P)-dependent dehydrogenase (short-subunit alcohol dehydrogenase family)